jgi:hypothetical protein
LVRLAAGQDFGEAVERKVDPAAAPAQRIDHFMARDGPKPRANRRILVPALPLEMNGKQRLLHNVLGVGIGHSSTGKAPARHRAKHRRQLQQETPVGIRVAGIAGTHQQGPLLFSSIASQNDPITLIRPPPACRYIVRAASLSRFCHGKYSPLSVTPALAPA